jgi:hypothetical protein
MSMGMVEHNDVNGAMGIGIYCGDRSMCEVMHNTVSGTRADHTSQDLSRGGYALVSWFESDAQVRGNTFVGNAHASGAFASSKIRPMR